MEPKKHYFAAIPSIALFLLFAVSPPLAIILFILKGIDENAQKEEQARSSSSASTPPFSTASNPSVRRAAPPPFRAAVNSAPAAAPIPSYDGVDHPTAEQISAQKRHKTITNLCTICGAVFLLAGANTLMIDGPASMTDVFTCLTQIIGGGGALWLGLRMNRARKLEQLLDKIVGKRDNIPLDELFAAAGVPAEKGRPAVESAIAHGYFGADAYIDNRTGTLIVRGEAPRPPQPEPAPQPAPAAEPEDAYASLLRQLRTVNDSIPDPVMTDKISRLEQLSARIFELARKDPAKKAQLQKFMDYYLPTALKLLNTYAALPAGDIQGQNIAEARQSIERSMDLLITAFENQLDKLFQTDALDVSTDIAALEGMLNLDGLTGGDFKA